MKYISQQFLPWVIGESLFFLVWIFLTKLLAKKYLCTSEYHNWKLATVSEGNVV